MVYALTKWNVFPKIRRWFLFINLLIAYLCNISGGHSPKAYISKVKRRENILEEENEEDCQ
jgi:hypothetical protein